MDHLRKRFVNAARRDSVDRDSSRGPLGTFSYIRYRFGHLLLKVISLVYNSPVFALWEQVFCTPGGRPGVLICTETSGPQGPLYAVGEHSCHASRALKLVTPCSSDPVYACHAKVLRDHAPVPIAAYQGCRFVSEISCEQHSNCLDRALVVPTVEGLGTEFFTGVV